MVTKHLIVIGDSQLMTEAEDESVQLIITSPPYNVGKNYGIVSDNLTENNYYWMLSGVFNECFRVLCDGGRLAVNIPIMGNNSGIKKSDKYMFYLNKYIDLLLDLGFNLREVITWVKTHTESDDTFCGNNTAWGSWNSPSNPYCRSFSEFIIIFHKNNPRLISKNKTSDMISEEFLKWTRNVWFFPAETDRTHSAPFPEELPKRLIKLYSFIGDTVLDCFAGSGTTGKVARQLNRNSIMYELNPGYKDLMLEKIGARQKTLSEMQDVFKVIIRND